MIEKNDIKLLDSTSNAVVAQHTGRRFPGVLIQGDTLSIIVDDIDELIDECDSGHPQTAKEIAKNIRAKIEDWLIHYERVLMENDIDLPYSQSMAKRLVK